MKSKKKKRKKKEGPQFLFVNIWSSTYAFHELIWTSFWSRTNIGKMVGLIFFISGQFQHPLKWRPRHVPPCLLSYATNSLFNQCFTMPSLKLQKCFFLCFIQKFERQAQHCSEMTNKLPTASPVYSSKYMTRYSKSYGTLWPLLQVTGSAELSFSSKEVQYNGLG